jgi:hypothetical protein
VATARARPLPLSASAFSRQAEIAALRSADERRAQLELLAANAQREAAELRDQLARAGAGGAGAGGAGTAAASGAEEADALRAELSAARGHLTLSESGRGPGPPRAATRPPPPPSRY